MAKAVPRNGVLSPVPARAPWAESAIMAAVFFLLLYAAFSPVLSNPLVDKIHALQAATFLSMAFLIGSLSRFWPKLFDPLKPYRQTLGFLGAVSAVAHVFMVYVPLGWNPSGWVLVSGGFVFVLFLAMALTSNRAAVEKLGYPLWKRFHTLGYVALFLLAVHFVLAETKKGVFSLNPLETAVLALVVITLLARAAAFLAGHPMRQSYDAHFGSKRASIKKR